MTTIEISSIQYDENGNPYTVRVDMQKVRDVCVDLIEDVDQTDDEGNLLINKIVVDGDVSEAVKRINALGYRTDEDSILNEDEE